MLAAGWPEPDIDEAITLATGGRIEKPAGSKPEFTSSQTVSSMDFEKIKSMMPAKYILVIGAAILLTILVFKYGPGLISGSDDTSSLCGNNELNAGETPYNCCKDAGCPGRLVCVNNQCREESAAETELQQNTVPQSGQQAYLNISSNQSTILPYSTQTVLTLAQNTSGKFRYKSEEHTLTIDKISGTTVTITVNSSAQSFKLNVGQSRKVDINGDLIQEVVITVSLISGQAKVTISELSPEVPFHECVRDEDCVDEKNYTRDFCNFTTNYRSSWCVHESNETDECQNHTDCDDKELFTRDLCAGMPKTCTHTVITECIGGDHICPLGCTYDSDIDCIGGEVLNLTCANLSGRICPQFSVCMNAGDYDNLQPMVTVNDTKYCCPSSTQCEYGDLSFPDYKIYVKKGKDIDMYFNLTSTFNVSIVDIFAKIYVNGIFKNESYVYASNFTYERVEKGTNPVTMKFCDNNCSDMNLTNGDSKVKIILDSRNKAKEVSEINNILEVFPTHMD